MSLFGEPLTSSIAVEPFWPTYLQTLMGLGPPLPPSCLCLSLGTYQGSIMSVSMCWYSPGIHHVCVYVLVLTRGPSCLCVLGVYHICVYVLVLTRVHHVCLCVGTHQESIMSVCVLVLTRDPSCLCVGTHQGSIMFMCWYSPGIHHVYLCVGTHQGPSCLCLWCWCSPRSIMSVSVCWYSSGVHHVCVFVLVLTRVHHVCMLVLTRGPSCLYLCGGSPL